MSLQLSRCVRDLSDAGFAVRAISDGAAAADGGGRAAAASGHHRLEYAGPAALDLIQGIRGRAQAAQRPTDHSVALSRRTGCGGGAQLRRGRLYRQAVFAAGSGGAGQRGTSHLSTRSAHSLPDLRRVGFSTRSTNRVTAGGKLIQVKGIEYRLLEFLMSHPGRTFNRTQLLTQDLGRGQRGR